MRERLNAWTPQARIVATAPALDLPDSIASMALRPIDVAPLNSTTITGASTGDLS